jgi:hypothetical protein
VSTGRHALEDAGTGAREIGGAALTRHVALTMPWGPLVVGCLAGIGVMIALRIAAGRIETVSALASGIRASFVPVMAGVAFLLPDAQRQLIATLPARPWLTPALRIALALPVLGLTGAIEAQLGASALAADVRLSGSAPAPLPWLALTGELTAWCALALALAAGVARTRWHDVAGLIAAFLAMAVIGALALTPWHLLPATIANMTGPEQAQWTAAWRAWCAAALVAAACAAWAAGDPWRRLRFATTCTR